MTEETNTIPEKKINWLQKIQLKGIIKVYKKKLDLVKKKTDERDEQHNKETITKCLLELQAEEIFDITETDQKTGEEYILQKEDYQKKTSKELIEILIQALEELQKMV